MSVILMSMKTHPGPVSGGFPIGPQTITSLAPECYLKPCQNSYVKLQTLIYYC